MSDARITGAEPLATGSPAGPSTTGARPGESTTGEPMPFVRKGLLRLSWPLLVVTVLTLLATLGNVMLLSMASPELNAAVSTSNQILGVMYDISVVFSIGALVVIAQLLGAGSFAAARRSSVIALRAASILGLGIAAFIAAFAPMLLRLVNTPDEIYSDALAYLWVVAAGLAFNAYIVTASAVLRAYGRTPALLLLGIIVNVFDVLLLFFFLQVMELGAVGAALPTLLVRGAGVLVLALLIRSRTGARFFGKLVDDDVPAASVDWARGRGGVGSMVRLSIPTVIENGAYNLVIVFTVSLINVLGTDAINARSYTLTLTALVTGVILALAQGNETIVGWDVGGGARARARRQTVRAMVWTAVASAVLALALWFFADAALSIFGVNNDVLEQARDALLISALLLPLSAMSATLFGALRSAGDVLIPMGMSLFASVVVLLPVSWLFIAQWEMGVRGVFWALVIAEAVKAGLLLARLLGERWLASDSSTSAVSAGYRPYKGDMER
ncbi:MAG: MATE family efflux transporter [Ancrocorticia sp.]